MRKLALIAALALPACAPDGPVGTIVGDVLLNPLRPANRPLAQGLGANGHHIIFVNFDGVTVQANYDDATNNQSSIAASVGHSIAVPAFDSSGFSNTKTRDQVVADVMAKTRAFYKDFNVDLVTTRPTSGDYVMTAVGGGPELIDNPCNQGGCIAGIAPLDCNSGQPIDYNPGGDVEVVFAFSDVEAQFGGGYAEEVLDLATTIAQETAHAYGLGHTANPQDVMYPYTSGQTVGFESGSYADGNNCAGGQGSQDSHAVLLATLGMSMGASDTTPPTVSISSPTQAQMVPRTFSVTASASDDTGVTQVSFSAQGPGTTASATANAAPWTATLTVDQDGVWAVTATASDAAGNTASATVSVTVKSGALAPFGSNCTVGTQCQSGQCQHGICNQSCISMACPAGFMCGMDHYCAPKVVINPGDVGASCMANGDCHSNLCATLGMQRFCTQSCKIGDMCPNGLVCTNFGTDGFLCAPPSGGNGGGGCALAPSSRRGAADLWLGLVAILGFGATLKRRRRRA